MKDQENIIDKHKVEAEEMIERVYGFLLKRKIGREIELELNISRHALSKIKRLLIYRMVKGEVSDEDIAKRLYVSLHHVLHVKNSPSFHLLKDFEMSYRGKNKAKYTLKRADKSSKPESIQIETSFKDTLLLGNRRELVVHAPLDIASHEFSRIKKWVELVFDLDQENTTKASTHNLPLKEKRTISMKSPGNITQKELKRICQWLEVSLIIE